VAIASVAFSKEEQFFAAAGIDGLITVRILIG
jgi:hypothetical protein